MTNVDQRLIGLNSSETELHRFFSPPFQNNINNNVLKLGENFDLEVFYLSSTGCECSPRQSFHVTKNVFHHAPPITALKPSQPSCMSLSVQESSLAL